MRRLGSWTVRRPVFVANGSSTGRGSGFPAAAAAAGAEGIVSFFQAEDGMRDLTVTGVQTCAVPILAVKKDGGWLINGSKNFITHGIHADACVAFASNDRAKQSKGITAFIFEKGMKGFAPSKKEKIGRASCRERV